jgi:hypothetical protein
MWTLEVVGVVFAELLSRPARTPLRTFTLALSLGIMVELKTAATAPPGRGPKAAKQGSAT